MIKRFDKTSITLADIIRRILLSFVFAALCEYLLLPFSMRDLSNISSLADMSLSRVIFLAAVCFVLTLLFSSNSKSERMFIALFFFVFSIAAIASSPTVTFLITCILLALILSVFVIRGWDKNDEIYQANENRFKGYTVAMAMISGIFFLFVSIWTVARIYNFSTPSYDFGIFAQMFYNMDTSGLPMTTLERDKLLSHFDVHMSPIYYLMLPFYKLFPFPATLQILQALVMTSSVIPLWKISRHHGFDGKSRLLVCSLLLLYPAFSGGASYDLHENCFLTPLLLWLFYGIDKKNYVIAAISACLTLAVKEDAAVYVAVIAIWLVLKTLLKWDKNKLRDLLFGASLLALSLLYFFITTNYLAKYGDGVMTGRYGNFIYDGSSSLVTVVKAVIKSPMKAVFECTDIEKLPFVALTLLPLLTLPFLTRRYERFVLLIPYILLNLMSDYPYQHDIFFQYTFGSIAFLIYLTLINLADIKHEWIRVTALVCAVTVSFICFATFTLPKAIRYTENAVSSYEQHQEIRDILSTIPDDAAVTATTFYTTELSRREKLYDLAYCSKDHLLESDYIVLQPNSSGCFRKYPGGYSQVTNLLKDNGYTEYSRYGNRLIIYSK